MLMRKSFVLAEVKPCLHQSGIKEELPNMVMFIALWLRRLHELHEWCWL